VQQRAFLKSHLLLKKAALEQPSISEIPPDKDQFQKVEQIIDFTPFGPNFDKNEKGDYYSDLDQHEASQLQPAGCYILFVPKQTQNCLSYWIDCRVPHGYV
jgi:hypothetical protein